ncbi:Mammalian cell entry related domain protein [Thermovibrio ammonificans HB-1]|uniref:Mammalian cell entry related domain protein n=1 Tax=Thermovibrio ammonificans (strain DSM 15698 / JCM 12110 / HB-1) TaxID=648996 RepID=E8T283_THEA1|nr:MlaD family protein [Thermovibrio ammonificans]ADU96978.1 Mammalian cell entry related domain protein [Thermovibrio ammonificans HB-1]
MGKLSLEAKVGALVIAGLTGLGVIATTLNPLQFKRGVEQKPYLIYFSNAAGLEKDAPVRVAGVTVGKVVKVGVKDGKAVVEIIFTKPVKLYKNAVAKIETMGLMGEKYVEIDPGHPPAPPLPPGSVIEQTQVPASMDQVMTSLNQLLEKFNQAVTTPDGKNRIAIIMDRINQLTASVNKVVNDVDTLLTENRKNVKKLIENALALTESLREELPQILDNVNNLTQQLSEVTLENRQDIRQLVRNLRLASDKAPQIAANLDQLTKNLKELLNEQDTKNIKETLANIKATTKELKELLAKVNSGKGTIGKLFNDESLYANLDKTVKTLGSLAEKVEKTQVYVGFRGDVNTRTGDSRGVFTLKVEPPEKDHYYLLEVVGNSQGHITYQKYYIDTGTTTGWREEVEKNYKTQFTLQYARIFNADWLRPGTKLVLRGGLKESSGGVGLDLLFNKRFMLVSDLWNTGRKDSKGDNIPPHLRVGVKYFLNKNWFVYGGGDELLYHKWRGVYLGAGVLFGDNDIKYLLGSMPGGIK